MRIVEVATRSAARMSTPESCMNHRRWCTGFRCDDLRQARLEGATDVVAMVLPFLELGVELDPVPGTAPAGRQGRRGRTSWPRRRTSAGRSRSSGTSPPHCPRPPQRDAGQPTGGTRTPDRPGRCCDVIAWPGGTSAPTGAISNQWPTELSRTQSDCNVREMPGSAWAAGADVSGMRASATEAMVVSGRAITPLSRME